MSHLKKILLAILLATPLFFFSGSFSYAWDAYTYNNDNVPLPTWELKAYNILYRNNNLDYSPTDLRLETLISCDDEITLFKNVISSNTLLRSYDKSAPANCSYSHRNIDTGVWSSEALVSVGLTTYGNTIGKRYLAHDIDYLDVEDFLQSVLWIDFDLYLDNDSLNCNSGYYPTCGSLLLEASDFAGGPESFYFVPENDPRFSEYQLYFANYLHSESYPSYSLMTSDYPMCYRVPLTYELGNVRELYQLPRFSYTQTSYENELYFLFEGEFFPSENDKHFIPKADFASDRALLENLTYVVSNYNVDYCNDSFQNIDYLGDSFNEENIADLFEGITFNEGLGRSSDKSEFFSCDIDLSGTIFAPIENIVIGACKIANAGFNFVYNFFDNLYHIFVPRENEIETWVLGFDTMLHDRFGVSSTILDDLVISDNCGVSVNAEVLGVEGNYPLFQSGIVSSIREFRPYSDSILVFLIVGYNVRFILSLFFDGGISFGEKKE